MYGIKYKPPNITGPSPFAGMWLPYWKLYGRPVLYRSVMDVFVAVRDLLNTGGKVHAGVQLCGDLYIDAQQCTEAEVYALTRNVVEYYSGRKIIVGGRFMLNPDAPKPIKYPDGSVRHREDWPTYEQLLPIIQGTTAMVYHDVV